MFGDVLGTVRGHLWEVFGGVLACVETVVGKVEQSCLLHTSPTNGVGSKTGSFQRAPPPVPVVRTRSVDLP